ncbi:DUF3854 domain-containing protein [Ornithinimicrobium humiphilum]|uniref:DUF3854 domain-containing protein n=1 Tax=Ornithinimicrobium humiphilum TaxID=125288 RepID=UPI00115225EA|nr:DUF3854 domain-containing protein [Ornithinimicrobium humiphilum]
MDQLTRTVEALRWSIEDYRPAITSAVQAEKLVLSAVAPLVAVAAGLRTLTREQSRAFGEDKLGGSPNSTARKQLQRMCTPAGLAMPWWRPDTLADALTAAERLGQASTPRMPPASSWQVRPDEPMADATGKPRKYENLTGQATVIGVHPSTPRSWLGARRVLLTEGLLKGASALTGLLLESGVDADKLRLTDAEKDMGPDALADAARNRLRDIMAGVPERHRVLVLVVVGVGNWHHNPEWNAIDLRGGKEVMVAFDGDVETNPAVYAQALQLFQMVENKGGEPSWLRIPDDGDAKRGIDDFLAVGTFGELLAGLERELPEPPKAETVLRNGDTRMNEEELRYEKFTQVTDEFGGTSSAWVRVNDIIGRVAATVQRRPATEAELETGRFDARASDDAEGDVKVEISLRGPDGNRVDATVHGPARLLAEPPDRWHLTEGARVPVRVLEQADWPPKDPDWLAGAKRHRVEERKRSFVWQQMGWVPTEAASPVFIAGNSVVGARGDAAAQAAPGITDREVPAASRFGLHPLVLEDGHMDKAAVADAVRTVLSTYTAGAWSSDGVAAVALAAALRPTVPVLPNSVIFFSGARRSGKALPMSTVLPTPVGNVCLGDLAVGDIVLAGDGTPTRVRSMSEVHRAPCVRVHLADGRELVTSTNHLWRARTRAQVEAGHEPMSERVRAGLESVGSGSAATLEALADALGLPEPLLEAWVVSAGIPFEDLASTYGPVRVYPVGEVLALASAMRGTDDPDHPTPFTTVTATALAVMCTTGTVQVDDGNGGWVDVDLVTVADTEWVRCITVEHWTGTFQAGDAVTTHNSWTAKQVMSFWQEKPGAFDRALPGTAADTGYYMENAVAHTPIWVADDVAPTVDKRKAEMTEAKIGDIIRAVFNQASKGRMHASGSTREMMRPRALFMVTAENPQAAASEMDRVVHVVTGEKFFGDDAAKDACDELARTSLVANHVTAACVQMVAASINRSGSWADVVAHWKVLRTNAIDFSLRKMGGGGKASRHAEMAGDLLLGLEVLDRLVAEVGLRDEFGPTVHKLRLALISYVRISLNDADATSPGVSIIRALRAALASGSMHLATSTSGQPPYLNSDDLNEQVRINQMLGWSYPSAEGQGERPGGRRVGELVQYGGAWYALFDPSVAFNEAQRAHPELILHGSKAEPTWASAWSEGLCGGPWARKKTRGGRLRSTARVQGRDVVQVPLSVLLGLDEPDSKAQQDPALGLIG